MDAVLYFSTIYLYFRESGKTPSSRPTEYPRPNQRNFLDLMSLLVKYNSIVKYQSDHLKSGQVSYLSKIVQNEIIHIMAETLRNSILNDKRLFRKKSKILHINVRLHFVAYRTNKPCDLVRKRNVIMCVRKALLIL